MHAEEQDEGESDKDYLMRRERSANLQFHGRAVVVCLLCTGISLLAVFFMFLRVPGTGAIAVVSETLSGLALLLAIYSQVHALRNHSATPSQIILTLICLAAVLSTTGLFWFAIR